MYLHKHQTRVEFFVAYRAEEQLVFKNMLMRKANTFQYIFISFFMINDVSSLWVDIIPTEKTNQLTNFTRQ